MKRTERPLKQLPGYILAGFVVLLSVQMGHHHWYKTDLSNEYAELSQPAQADLYHSLAMGSDRLLSYLLLLSVQMHDNQTGQHLDYIHINYETLQKWLMTLYELNPDSDYPAFLASRVYSSVKDRDKVRLMVDVIDTLFDKNPSQHWRRLTEACLLAKHRLEDLTLALKLAKKISALPKSMELPFWARDMELILLDELNELESAQLLISSMLQSNEINDADEIRFLKFRLLKIQQAMLKNKQKAY